MRLRRVFNKINEMLGEYFMEYSLRTKNVRIWEFSIVNEMCTENFPDRIFIFAKAIVNFNNVCV